MRLLNRISDYENQSPNRSKRNQEHRHGPKPQSNPTFDSETELELDPSLESSIEDRFDPDEAYEGSSTSFYRDK